jgi:hypothetical protein
MLKEQQTPRSVGKGAKMAEHGTATPFHSQYFSTGTEVIKLFFRPKSFTWVEFLSENWPQFVPWLSFSLTCPVPVLVGGDAGHVEARHGRPPQDLGSMLHMVSG